MASAWGEIPKHSFTKPPEAKAIRRSFPDFNEREQAIKKLQD